MDQAERNILKELLKSPNTFEVNEVVIDFLFNSRPEKLPISNQIRYIIAPNGDKNIAMEWGLSLEAPHASKTNSGNT
jgi:hypothetical protein